MRLKLLSILVLLTSLCALKAQNTTVRFVGQSQNGFYMQLDSVAIRDNSRQWEMTIYYPDTVMIARLTGIENQKKQDFYVSQNNPNPFDGTTEVTISIPYDGNTIIRIYDINGKLITQHSQDLNTGTHKFEINLAFPQTYILSASINGKTSSIKMVNTGHGSTNTISYLGTTQQKIYMNGLFELGDEMVYTGYATYDGGLCVSEPVTRIQNSSEVITLHFAANVQHAIPTVNTLQATSISINSATLNGNASCECTMEATGFYYSKYENNITAHTATSSQTSGNFSCHLTGLEPNTTYYYKAFAIKGGQAYTGQTLTFTTQAQSNNYDIRVTFTSNVRNTVPTYYNYMYLPLDSVKVNNLTRQWETTLIFPDTTMNIFHHNGAKNNVYENYSYGDNMYYTGYVSYRGTVYTQYTQRTLQTSTIQFLFYIPLCADKYTNIDISDCEPITYNGVTYTHTGRYEIGHYQTVESCDSFVYLNVNINNTIFNNIYVTTCSDSYTWGNNTYTESGIYQQTYTSVHGCDSMVTLGLTLGNGFTDERDGNSYCIVQIGDQIWMAENLRYLPSVYPRTDESGYSNRYYIYNYTGYDVEAAKATYNYSEYGVLYNCPAAQTACPAGWHLPSDSEWTELEIYLQNNGYNFDGYIDNDNNRETHNVIGKALASTTGWTTSDVNNSPGCIPEKNNSSGLNVKPAGWKSLNSQFRWINEEGGFWTSSLQSSSRGYDRYVHFARTHVTRSYNEKYLGMSVRCIQD